MKIFKHLTLDQFFQEEKRTPSDKEIGYFPNQVNFNECFIVKPNPDDEYPSHISFLVYCKERFVSNKLKDQITWHFLGAFTNLKSATTYSMFTEDKSSKWEYYVQNMTERLEEGGSSKNPQIEVMGSLGWELCSIFNGKSIYKRKLI